MNDLLKVNKSKVAYTDIWGFTFYDCEVADITFKSMKIRHTNFEFSTFKNVKVDFFMTSRKCGPSFRLCRHDKQKF